VNDARNRDPWLEGERCPPTVHGDGDLHIEDVVVGPGRVVDRGDTVRVHYTASVTEAKIRDSRDSGAPIEIIIGSSRTVCGIDRALVGMRAGGRRRVLVPWYLAFGENGRPPDIKPRTDIAFVIDLFVPPELGSDHGSSSGSPPPNPVRSRRR
jgi:FKBP-type peptidyl-prolyl cis-trans isomerase